MREHGFDVTVVAPHLDEPEWIGARLPPFQRAEALSYFKARSVADRLDFTGRTEPFPESGGIPPLPRTERGRGEGPRIEMAANEPPRRVRILAGDTVVALDGRLFGKPTDRADARRILSALSGTTHHVITGVALLDIPSPDSTRPRSVRRADLSSSASYGSEIAGWGTHGWCRLIRHDTTAVTMRRLTDAERETYLDTGAWKGKAGAYGIQDSGDAFVERIDGSFTNVVGFPMELILQMLKADASS